MKTKMPTLTTAPKLTKKRVYKTLDAAVQAKSESMEMLFAHADWSTLKRP